MIFYAPDDIPSGWTTFRLSNESELEHFALIDHLPEGIGVENHRAEVGPVFQEGMDLLKKGEVDSAMVAFGKLPEWYGQVVYMGGPGFLSPGHATQTTVYLEPGTYLLECYVKTNGIFHPMTHEFTVTEAANEGSPPEPTLELTVSSEHGIEFDGDVTPGVQTVAVHFADQTAHEHFLGHDVHLVRLEDDTDMEALAGWMDWSQPTGLETPAPAVFLGGTHEMPAGQTAYVTVHLEPGRYAWIAEVPDPAGKGMLKTFVVTPGRSPEN